MSLTGGGGELKPWGRGRSALTALAMAGAAIFMVVTAIDVYADASGAWSVMTGGEGRDIRMPMWMRFSMVTGTALLCAVGSVAAAILFVRGPDKQSAAQTDQGERDEPEPRDR